MNDFFYLQMPSGEIKPSSGYWQTATEAFTYAPAVESDPAVSEALFLEFCEKHKTNWTLCAGGLDKFTCSIHIPHGRSSVGCGATPSEARAKALYHASEAMRKEK